MRKFVHAAAAASVLLATAGCQNAFSDADGPLTGTWRFTATGYQPNPTDSTYVCDLQTTYVMRQEGSEIEGRSDAATFHCRNKDTGRVFPSDFKEAGVVRGPVKDGAFYLSDSGNWHCLGELSGSPARLEGHLESYGGWVGQPMQTVRSGTCVLEKVSNAGYDGPAA